MGWGVSREAVLPFSGIRFPELVKSPLTLTSADWILLLMTKRALINFNPSTLYIVLTPVYIL